MSPRVGVAASFTCDPLRRWLEFWLSELGLRVDLTFAGYAQLGQELNRPAAYRGADGCVALLNFADWQRTTPLAFDAQRFERDLDLLCEAIRAALPQLSGRLVLLLCPARPVGGGAERADAFSSATARLKETARREPRLSVLSASELAAWYPVAAPHDRTADELGHVPYSEPMWCALGAAVARLLLPSLAPPLKCVVVDCDYTLWHHAVGEVGAEGVVVEPRHRELQERLLALREAGVLICLCSKNEPASVDQVLARGVMPLRSEHVSAARVAPLLCKARAVAELAAELGLAQERLLLLGLQRRDSSS